MLLKNGRISRWMLIFQVKGCLDLVLNVYGTSPELLLAINDLKERVRVGVGVVVR